MTADTSSRYCSQCGTEVHQGAAFCVSCGASVGGAQAAPADTPGETVRRFAPLIIVGTLLAVAGLAVGVGYLNQPPPNQPLARSGGGAPPPGAAPQLPADHPPIDAPAEVPEDVRKAIVRMETLAKEQPDNLDAWKQLAFVQYRAGQVDTAYLDAAEASYRHVLDRDAKDLDALRGLGNVAYDHNDPTKALEFYRSYLEIEPGDKSVRTDMGTMLLAAKQPEQAIRTYQGILQEDPTFFQAQFNLAIAYRAAGKADLALAALQRSREVAPDDESKKRVEAVLAHVSGAAEQPAATAGGTFRDAVEAVFRSHPIVGPRIDAILWESDQKAKVTLREFPMDGMPPMVREKFIARLSSGIQDSKKRFTMTEAIGVDIVDAGSGNTMLTITD